MVRGQQTESAFVADVRVFGVAERERNAERVVQALREVFEARYDDPEMDQGLVGLDVPSWRLSEWFDWLVERRVPDTSPVSAGTSTSRAS